MRRGGAGGVAPPIYSSGGSSSSSLGIETPLSTFYMGVTTETCYLWRRADSGKNSKSNHYNADLIFQKIITKFSEAVQLYSCIIYDRTVVLNLNLD